MTTRLTDEQRQAVDQHHGFLEVEAGGRAYVVMSMQVYREMMGVGSEAEYRASIEAIREGLRDVEGGRTRPLDEFFEGLGRKQLARAYGDDEPEYGPDDVKPEPAS